MNLIGITGQAGSGKTTAASYLSKYHDYTHLKFATGLKEMLRVLMELVGETEIDRRIEGDLKHEPVPYLAGKTPRFAMQTLGTEWGRDCMGDDLWIRICGEQIRTALSRGEKVVIDDVRFDNEAELIRQLGGKVLRLNARGGIAGNHVSERGVAADFWYDNDRSINDFHIFLATHVVAG